MGFDSSAFRQLVFFEVLAPASGADATFDNLTSIWCDEVLTVFTLLTTHCIVKIVSRLLRQFITIRDMCLVDNVQKITHDSMCHIESCTFPQPPLERMANASSRIRPNSGEP